MGRTGIGSAINSPFRIEPQAMKVFEDFSETEADMSSDVFENNNPWSNFSDDSGDIGPEVSGVGFALSVPCLGEGLAWVPGMEDIHSATPRLAIEGLEIVPYRSRIQRLVFHPRHEQGRSVGFPLDVANSSRSKDCIDSKVESADP